MTSTPKKTGNKQSGFIEKGLESLAINGGKPVRETPLPYSRHTITEDDKKAVIDALESDWIAGNGPIVKRFEEAIAEYTGYNYAIAVNSATSGLNAACHCFYGSGHFHIPALTFVATANMAIGANMSFSIVDVLPRTLVCDISFQKAIGVSYAGYPVVNTTISDDAHYLYPHMSWFKRNDISVISLHPAKHISAGEGGVIFTNYEDLYEQMSAFVDHGRGVSAGFSYGHNFRMPSINAALALSQLERMTDNISWKQEIARRYREAFAGIDWIELPPDHKYHTYHLFVLRLRGVDRDAFRRALETEGILTQVHYPPLYTYHHLAKYTYTAYSKIGYSVSTDVWNNGVSIPMFSGMTEQDVNDVINAVHKIAENV